MTLNKIKYDVFSPICLVIYIKRMKMKKNKNYYYFFFIFRDKINTLLQSLSFFFGCKAYNTLLQPQ